MDAEQRRLFENQNAIMGALAMLMRPKQPSDAALALAESRLVESIAKTRTLTEPPPPRPGPLSSPTHAADNTVPVLLLQARYVLKNLDAERPGAGYMKLAQACADAAEAMTKPKPLEASTAPTGFASCPHWPQCAKGARECVCAAMGQ